MIFPNTSVVQVLAKSEEPRGHDYLQIVCVYKVEAQPEVCNKTHHAKG